MHFPDCQMTVTLSVVQVLVTVLFFFTEGYVLELRPKYNLNFEFLFSELQKTKPLNREDQGFGK